MVFLGVNPAFEVTEELASMSSLHCKTIGENIFEQMERTLVQYNLKGNLLRCVQMMVVKIFVFKQKKQTS